MEIQRVLELDQLLAQYLDLFLAAAELLQLLLSGALPRELLETFFTRQKLPEGSDWALGWDTPTEGASSSGTLFSKNSIGHLGFTGTSLWFAYQAIVSLLNDAESTSRSPSPSTSPAPLCTGSCNCRPRCCS